ncbi:MAG: hypothetical protein Q9222_002542 [Ikaeria aurantiellina]
MSGKLQTWQAMARTKVAEVHSKIPKEWKLSVADLQKARTQRNLTGPFIEQFLNDDEKEVVRMNTVSLVDKIHCGHYTAVDVTRAYCKTAAIAHQLNNCLHEIMFDFAKHTAKALDQHYADNGQVKGPLHGLPVSLKDQFHVSGHDTTMGYVGWIGTYEGKPDPSKVRRVDSQVVKELLSLGAVLFCKTSVSQTLLYGETINNIIDTTLNPVNQLLSCGGSSGGGSSKSLIAWITEPPLLMRSLGEAALQALRGSSVGLGTDTGGSVRIPAAFCGTYSIKPTHNRISYRDVANTNPGQDVYPSSVGVMGTSIDAVTLVLASLISTCPWNQDPNVVRMPWNKEAEIATLARANADGSAGLMPLKIGIYWTDGVVTPHPPVHRGLLIVYDVLKALGHKVVEWIPPPHTRATSIHTAFLKADGYCDIHKQLGLSGEPLMPRLRTPLQRRDPMPLLDYQYWTMEGKAYSEAYSDYWNSTGEDDGQIVDAVLMPVAPHAAVTPGKFYHTGEGASVTSQPKETQLSDVSDAVAYTQIVNLLDYSAAVLPVTRADKLVDKYGRDNPDTYDGAPVGLQLVARKWEEEKVCAIAKIVDTALKSQR